MRNIIQLSKYQLYYIFINKFLIINIFKAAFFEKNINVDGKRLRLSIWVKLLIYYVVLYKFQDTAGQEKFHALGPIYYRDSKGAILVYDITDKDSFTRVTNINVYFKL